MLYDFVILSDSEESFFHVVILSGSEESFRTELFGEILR